PPYIRCPYQIPPLNQESSSESPFKLYSHQLAPLHQVSPSECLHQSSRYINCPQQSATLHQGPFQSVPLHQSAPLHEVSPSECPFTSGVPIRVPPYIRCSIRVQPYINCPQQSSPLH
ncbi:unnamed protein product, partial [Staurois parvus]